MFYVGIDVSKHEHVIGVTDKNGKKLKKPLSIPNSMSGFDRASEHLENISTTKKDLLVGMEATGHYWLALFCYLQNNDYSVVVINPIRTDAMRRFKGSSRVKTDAIDCFVIAETLRCGDFNPSKLSDESLIEMRNLTRLHQSLKMNVADLKRQVITALDQVFPEYVSIFF